MPELVPKPPSPNAPFALRAEPEGQNRVRLFWSYIAVGQQVEPIDFRIFGGETRVTIDYVNEIDSETYVSGQAYYSLNTQGSTSNPHGKPYMLDVAAVGPLPDEAQTLSGAPCRVTLLDTPPPVLESVFLAHGDEQ